MTWAVAGIAPPATEYVPILGTRHAYASPGEQSSGVEELQPVQDIVNARVAQAIDDMIMREVLAGEGTLTDHIDTVVLRGLNAENSRLMNVTGVLREGIEAMANSMLETNPRFRLMSESIISLREGMANLQRSTITATQQPADTEGSEE